MLRPEFTGQFKRDFRLAVRRGHSPKLLETVVTFLSEEQPLPEKYRDHALVNTQTYHNMRECHIEPDWLLIYQIQNEKQILKLIRTGSHSDLF